MDFVHTVDNRNVSASLNNLYGDMMRARSAPSRASGFTFAKARREEKKQSLTSPGPIYGGYDVHNNIVHKSVSIPKGPRSSVFDQITCVSPGPAAPYNPINLKSKTSISFPKAKRFADEEIKFKDTKLTPGPGYYTSSLTESTFLNDSPAFTFGYKREDDKKFSDDMDFKGPYSESPGPVYDVDGSYKMLEQGPKISFSKGPRHCNLSIYGPMNEKKPSPGDHEIGSKIGKETPAFSFGTSNRSNNTNRTETPGPIYHPDVSKIKDSHRNVLFGRMERSQLSTPKRFISDKISLTENYGLHSPGPAFYSPEKVNRSPLITITGKEKEVTEFVYPQARRPRFLSKELSVENQGQWSPGPKYAPPSTLSGPKFSFGAQDDHTKTKSHAPRDAYEKMSHGPYIRPNTKMNTPGPKYNVRREPTSDMKPFTIPKAAVNTKEKTVDPVPGPGQYGTPDISTVGKVVNSAEFRSMGKPRNKKTSRLDFGSLGKDSPGPAYMHVDLTSLSRAGTKKSATWGGLS